MKRDENQFLDNLASDLKPGRFWTPQGRTGGFLLFLLLGNFAILLSEQGFRPGFIRELIQHPVFLLELVSVSVFTACSIFYVFASFVPGYQITKTTKALGLISSLVFLGTLVLSFMGGAPESTFSGARVDCRTEIFIYSLLGTFAFAFFVWKNPYPTHRFGYLFMGMASAAVPGAIMQVACMYSPMHSLDHHYGPALLVTLIIGGIFPWVRSRNL